LLTLYGLIKNNFSQVAKVLSYKSKHEPSRNYNLSGSLFCAVKPAAAKTVITAKIANFFHDI
jgi:hypothetical protein